MPHSKNTRVSVTRKRVHWGQTPFRVNDDPEISQLDAKYDPELGQSDPIICQFDWFPGHRWPGMEFGPNGPFSGSRLTRVFLECTTHNLPLIITFNMFNVSKLKKKILATPLAVDMRWKKNPYIFVTTWTNGTDYHRICRGIIDSTDYITFKNTICIWFYK